MIASASRKLSSLTCSAASGGRQFANSSSATRALNPESTRPPGTPPHRISPREIPTRHGEYASVTSPAQSATLRGSGASGRASWRALGYSATRCQEAHAPPARWRRRSRPARRRRPFSVKATRARWLTAAIRSAISRTRRSPDGSVTIGVNASTYWTSLSRSTRTARSAEVDVRSWKRRNA